MGLLTKEAVQASQLPTERVPTPELGADTYVIVRGIGGTQRDAYEKGMWLRKGGKPTLADNARAKLIVQCLIDEDGDLQYTSADVTVIGRLRGDVLERIFDTCRRLSGMTEQELEEKKELSE